MINMKVTDDAGKLLWTEVRLSPSSDSRYHCDYGPAIESPAGLVKWYIYGKRYSFDDWCALLNKTEKEKALLLLKYS